jgi:hypothetical protein
MSITTQKKHYKLQISETEIAHSLETNSISVLDQIKTTRFWKNPFHDSATTQEGRRE